MPRKKIRSKRKDAYTFNPDRLNDAQRFFLKTGVVLSGCERDLGFNKNDTEKTKLLWRLHKADVMSEFKQDIKNAGRRPWAFWQFDMPEPFAVTHIERQVNNFDGSVTETCFYESKADYLVRLGLLEPWEIEAMNMLPGAS